MCAQSGLSALRGIKEAGFTSVQIACVPLKCAGIRTCLCRARYLISSLNRRVLRAIHQMNLLPRAWRQLFGDDDNVALLCVCEDLVGIFYACVRALRACFARFNLQYITARWTPRDRRRAHRRLLKLHVTQSSAPRAPSPSVPHLGALGRRR